MQQVRVLNVIAGLAARTGGPAVGLVDSTPFLADLGVERQIFTTDIGHAASARRLQRAEEKDFPEGAAGLAISVFPVRPPHRLVYSPELRRGLARAARTVDVVHIHSLYLYPQLAAYRQAWRSDVPYIVSPHGSLDPYLRRRGQIRKKIVDVSWQGRMLERAAALHVTTEEERRLIADIAPHVPRMLVPNGIHAARYEMKSASDGFRDRFLDGHTGPILLYLGRISHKKGIDLLIDALPEVRSTVPDALLVIVGPDDEGLLQSLKAQAIAAGVGSAVRFLGPLFGKEKLEALHAASVWLLASHTENFGIAVVEAMAAGCPVIVSDAVNIAPDIERANAGIVVPRLPEAIAEATVRVLCDQSLADQVRRNAASHVGTYDWATIAPKLAAMYREISRGPSG